MPLPRTDYRYPVGYQQDAVTRLLASLVRFRGALLIASTGLGKTVIATETARRLRRDGRIEDVLVIAPNAVRVEWAAHLDAARLPFACFNHAALDAPPERSAAARDLGAVLGALGPRTLLVIDECHLLRNRARGTIERRAFVQLLPAVAASGGRVLLLTATPFSRGLANLNAQLSLLPHTAPSRALLVDWVTDARAWHVTEEADIAQLPVITVLTTPSIARAYGERDDVGTFVRFGLQRRYFPRLRLHRVNTPVVAGAVIAAALDGGVFAVEGGGAGLERVVRLSLTSSPWALAECIAKTIATPGPDGFARARFLQPPDVRAAALGPAMDALRATPFGDDPKLQALLNLLDARCAEGGKAVVFVERLATAGYVAAALAALRPALRIGCTVTGAGDGPLDCMPRRFRQRSDGDVRSILRAFAPVANGVKGALIGAADEGSGARVPRRTAAAKRAADRAALDVLIATDAWGVGVNLQDAATVISYDLAWTPIELTQRAGRILRLWREPRTVDIYAFVPHLGVPTMDAGFRKLWAVARRWERLVARHAMAARLGELPTLAGDEDLGEIELERLAT
ncbi:MAG: helicase-related protein [Ardenticatenales bacterium]